MFLFVLRLGVFRSVPCGLKDSYGSVCSLTRKGWWLMFWTHPSIWVHTSLLVLLVVLGSCSLWFSDAPDLLRSAGFKVSRYPPFSVPGAFLSQSSWLFQTVLLERALMLAVLLRELLVVVLDSVLAAVPFTSLNLIAIRGLSLFSFFCNLVSRPYAGSLSCARENWSFVRIVLRLY
jgi:hypothetical protein